MARCSVLLRLAMPVFWCLALSLLQGAWAVSVLDYPKLCPNQTTFYGRKWPTRYYANDCVLPTQDNATRQGAADINLVVLSPYVGALGDMVTMTEPMMLLAAQEIEDSGLLPGYRLRFHLADSQCTAPEATGAVVRAFSTPPRKHGLIGDCCSAACTASNVAARYFDVLQISPNCQATDLSVRANYPYFLRMVASSYPQTLAFYEVAKTMQWHRVAIVRGPEDINLGGINIMYTFMANDTATYAWTILMSDLVTSAAGAKQTIQNVRRLDARIVFTFCYENTGALLFCEAQRQGLYAPAYVFYLAAAIWAQDFMAGQEAVAKCTREEMYQAGFGAIGPDRGGLVTTTGVVHGLSGRKLSDVLSDYMASCMTFADGQGACNPVWAGYFYDSLWEFAWILHTYLVVQGGAYSTLASDLARDRLFQLGLRANFQGITGRVRHFNGVDPTTTSYGGSFGDREGDIAMKQIVALPPKSFAVIGTWSRSNVVWVADILWSPSNSSLRVPCATGMCNFSAGWVPRDRGDSCPPGSVWKVEAGCEPCATGSFGAPGALQCTLCGPGTFSNVTGTITCPLCPPGTANGQLGATRCRTCDAGGFLTESGGSECAWCSLGSFSQAQGASECALCNASFTTANVASRSAAECDCGEGTYLPVDGGHCQACPEGFRCPFGSHAANIPASAPTSPPGALPAHPQVSPGFYSLYSDPFSLYMCDNEAICPGGLPESCAQQHWGLACGKCEARFYRSSKGECLVCKRQDIMPAIAVAIALLLLVNLLLAYTLYDSGDQRLTLVTAVLAIGQLLCAVQALGIIAQLQLRWAEPILTVLRIGSLLSLDVDVLKVQCILGQDSPTLDFVVRFLAAPAAAAALALVMQLHALRAARANGQKWYTARIDTDRYLNSLGLLLVMAYVPVTIAMLRPLHCTANPNGRRSMASSKAVLCWHSGEHQGLVVIGLIGLLCCPVALISKVGLAVLRYPRLVAAGLGPQFLASHRFLFARFKPELFQWGFFYLLRNLAMSLVPVVSPDSALWQVALMSLLVMISLVAEALLLPWRTALANASELTTLFGLLLFLQVAAFFIPVGDFASNELIAGLLMAIFACTAAVTLGIAVHAAVRYVRPGVVYSIFLCHHKDGAGSLARWFKLRISITSQAAVFLDSDQLEDLDLVVDTVQSHTRNLVVLLTRMTLTRSWCAAEIAAAFKSKVKVVPVACCDYLPPSEAFIEKLPELWSHTQLQALAHYGILLDDIRAGFLGLADLEAVALKRFAPVEEQQQVVADVMRQCGLTTRSAGQAGASRARGAQALIIGASGDAEARCTCEVLRHYVEQKAQIVVACVHRSADVARVRDTAVYLLVIFTRGVLTDVCFEEVALAFARPALATLEVVTALADTSFAFPAVSYFEELEKLGGDKEVLSRFLRRVFNVLALPVSAQGSASVLEAQVAALCRRFTRTTRRDTRRVISLNRSGSNLGSDGSAGRVSGSSVNTSAGPNGSVDGPEGQGADSSPNHADPSEGAVPSAATGLMVPTTTGRSTTTTDVAACTEVMDALRTI